MEDAALEATSSAATSSAEFDFAQFRRWYNQAGTPVLQLERHWDAAGGTLTLTARQHTPHPRAAPQAAPGAAPGPGAGGPGRRGRACAPGGESELEAAARSLPPRWGQLSRLLVVDQAEQRFVLTGLEHQPHPPALSLLRRFSTPVRLEVERSSEELLHLLAHDSEPVARWDAGQTLLRRALIERAAGGPNEPLEEGLVAGFERILRDGLLSEANRSVLLDLPGLAELEAEAAEPDPPALFAAQLALERRFGSELAEPLLEALPRCTPQWDLPWPQGVGDRMLTATIWAWRAAAGEGAAIAAAAAAVEGPSMTLARAGLRALQPLEHPAREQALAAFYARWQDKPVILDAWFALEASAPLADGLERVQRLLEHPRFDPAAPNSVRAVLGGLAGNPPVFHAADGSGYRFMAARIAELDRRNPITASRLAKVFSRWQSYGAARGAAQRAALEQLADERLSTNTREVVEQCLGTEPQR
ncbi:DUF3458 domain-containing protein [Cyanobium sp. ATX-6F1]|uniref:DUF3458 domain-containing protein n=1 Tax=Cyanobium sp. ATX-6F1 TaxID=3137388 RepID=UPI0039BE75E5